MFKILNVLESIIITDGKRKKILHLEDITKKAEKKYEKDLKNKEKEFDKKIFEIQKEQLEEKIRVVNYEIEKLEENRQYYTYELSKLLKKKINKKIGVVKMSNSGVIQFKNREYGVILRLKE